MAKYIDAEKLIVEIERFSITEYGDGTFGDDVANGALDYVLEKIIPPLQQKQTDMGEVSDGYHTFNELYYYRMLYNAAFFNGLAYKRENGTFDVDYGVHKSKRHSDGEECFGGGWFVVMANLPTGQISNHYELKDWDLFKVPEKEFADEWDGHTPQEAAERLHKYLQQEQQGVDEPEYGPYARQYPKSEVSKMQSEEDFEEEWEKFEDWVESYNQSDYPTCYGPKQIARHFYELGLKAKKEE